MIQDFASGRKEGDRLQTSFNSVTHGAKAVMMAARDSRYRQNRS
jgi:hypothetical protein